MTLARRAGAAWLALVVAGATVIVRLDIAERREAFRSEARSAHRLLSQRTAQHDAVLATLALLDGGTPAPGDAAARRLPAIYPQIVAVQRRAGSQAWPDGWPAAQRLAQAELESRSESGRDPPHPGGGPPRAVLAQVDTGKGHYALLLAGPTASHMLHIDAHRLVAAADWPLRPGGPVAVRLLPPGDAPVVLQDGRAGIDRPFGLTAGFRFAEPIASASQPFVLAIDHATGPAQWPWALLCGWTIASALLVFAVVQRLAAGAERRRVEQVARLGRIAQLNGMGELAAGIAHELNQPLAAVLAGAQAALRALPPPADNARQGADADGDPALAREAIALAAGQARRAADVLARLRRLVEPAHGNRPREPVALQPLARQLLALLAPEFERRGIAVAVRGEPVSALADPVAVEQILHNLLVNAMQALAGTAQPCIDLLLERRQDSVQLAVSDNGHGIPADALPHLFEPFFTRRRDAATTTTAAADEPDGATRGLGLGLALCETLAQAQGGGIVARNRQRGGGAEFVLTLPVAATSGSDR